MAYFAFSVKNFLVKVCQRKEKTSWFIIDKLLMRRISENSDIYNVTVANKHVGVKGTRRESLFMYEIF